MLKQAAEKFIGCGGNDTEASALMYIGVSGCMLQTQVRKLSSKEHSKKAPHS